ncbi:FAD-binding oxidoreductase [Actinomadura litoris]|uniref:FAD-binding protein n=1 Tax=Actinomadura litoris TaxID=2678616 RepID=A0A7K1L3G7_9ACTN|nr:FAD-dependent oxidoreductase [Actinomadura litoris]MUN38978.1 FAD-binding protein [Actinomadura litoris]
MRDGILDDLRDRVAGPVLLPGDAGYEAARTPWNLSVDQRVDAVVEAAHADDVVAAVRFARERGLGVSAQPSGHGAAPLAGGTILLRTGALDEVSFEPGRAAIRVGAGVPWSRVQEVASPHGLTGLLGSAPHTSVVGYTLGGGLSWFSRRWGRASDHVTAFDVVTADGETARVEAESDPELFWALRGGGGDFAIVTAMEFGLQEAGLVHGGQMMWPGAKAAAVLAAFREVTWNAPPELTVWLRLFRPPVPDGEPMVIVDSAFLGAAHEAERLLKPLAAAGAPVLDTRRGRRPADLGDITGDPVDPSPLRARTEMLTDLDDTTLYALAGAARDLPPLVAVQIRHLDGALTASTGAAGPIGDPFLISMMAVPFGPPEPGLARRRALADALSLSGGPKPFTLLAPEEAAAAAFAPRALDRLRAIKHERDPDRVVRSNHPVLG